MKFENKIKLRTILRDVSEVDRHLKAFDFKSMANKLEIVQQKLIDFASRVRLNEISEEEDE
jgi:hypothetical protein